MDYTILSITIILMGFSFLMIEKQPWLMADRKIRGVGVIIFFMFIMTASVFMSAAQQQTTATLFPMNVITNTVYQNTNSSSLFIYATASGGVQSFMGNSIADISFVQSSGSQTLVVPPFFYYQLNYTGSYTSFAGEILNTS